MFQLSMTFNGKHYDDMEEAVHDMAVDAIITAIKQNLRPFENEIAEQGGSVQINVGSDYHSQIIINNVSEDLKERIESSFQ